MPRDKAPEPNNFPTFFFKIYWCLINEVVDMFHELDDGG